MSRRKLSEFKIRKLHKTKLGSVYLTLPIQFIRKLKWRSKQKVTVKQRGNKLIIQDWEK